MKILKKYDLLSLHISFLLLLIVVIIFFITLKKAEISLTEGDKIDISLIKKNMGLQSFDDDFIIFEKFKIEKFKNKEIYKSYLKINGKKSYILEVNKPLKLNKLYFYQNSWQIGVKKLIFTFNGKKYNIFKVKRDSLKTDKGYTFYFYPVEMDSNHNVLYKWVLFNKDKKIINKGNFYNSDDKLNTLFKLYGFKILEQEFSFITVLDVFYKPLNNLVAFFSILFLGTLGFTLWREQR